MDKGAIHWQIKGLSVQLGLTRVVADASLSVRSGELVALVGANGAGKSSLVRAGLGLLPSSNGASSLDGHDLTRMSPIERARQISYLPQSRPLAWPLKVRDVVALGRFAYGAAPDRLSPMDASAVDAALDACGLAHLAMRQTNMLSGGELARVHVARALANEAPLLVADEPTAALDPAQALSIMEVLTCYCASGGAALVILHDLSLAARFASRIVVMSQGQILADAPPREAMRPDVLRQAFCLEAILQEHRGVPYLAIMGMAGAGPALSNQSVAGPA